MNFNPPVVELLQPVNVIAEGPQRGLGSVLEGFVESHIRPYLVDLIGLAAASGAIYGLVWGHIPFGNVATLVALAGTYLGSKLGR